MTPLLRDVDEAAHDLRISRRQIFRLIATGELDSLKVGARRMITTRSIEALIDRAATNRSEAS